MAAGSSDAVAVVGAGEEAQEVQRELEKTMPRFDWDTGSAEAGERQRSWSLAAASMAASLWSAQRVRGSEKSSKRVRGQVASTNARRKAAAHVGREGRAVAMHCGHVIIQSNTWRAVN
jgi:hypothetical protein